MQRKFSTLILFIFCLISLSAYSQSAADSDKKKDQRNYEMDRGATYGEYESKKKFKKKRKAKYDNLDFEGKIKEYEKLMEANAKKYKKMEKELKKPQYSDPTYFGHKKKPKKRKPGKRKLCKECNIVH